MIKTVNILKLFLAAATIILLAKASQFVYQYKLLDRWWFNISHSLGIDDAGQEGKLHAYSATIQGKKVEGATGLSSLTYNTSTHTLFTIGDDRNELFELSTSGDVIRRIPFEGFHEVEGIQYVEGNRFLILEEEGNRLSLVEIDSNTVLLDSSLASITLKAEYTPGNKNFEGLAYSRELDRIYVGKERDPIRIYEIDGFASQRKPASIAIRGNEEREENLFIKDLSGLEIDPATGYLLVMSHESRIVLELNKDDRPISTLSLLKGQSDLDHMIPQAEGIAFDPDGTLYIMSEPNLFYAFKRT